MMLAQTSSQKAAVQLSATVSSSPASITLSWTSLASTTSITIYRKLATATAWGSAIATPSASSLSYTDAGITVGVLYEYRVVRVAGGVTGNGYMSSGVAVPPTDYRGRIILLVDNTFSTSLAAELTTLVGDLKKDGWAVSRSDLARTTPQATVKSTILSVYNSDPANTKAVFIVGHLAVPYSGNQAPDGHGEHSGAWPCDGYYGELNGTWTDNTVNSGSMQRPQNTNVPGDGKFDQSNFPSDLELQVGRIDFYDMPAFALNETELTRNYLNKAHNFKVKQWTPQTRGIMFDNLQWVSNPLAASGWRSMAPLVGPANITTALQAAWPFYTLVNNNSYLWTYSSGGGAQETTQGVITYHGAGNVGSVHDYAASNMNGVFNMAFGSYFGDWDNKNNFLRAPLASGQALTNVWSAIPGWYFHHMGMGANIGASTLATMNNNGIYAPITDGWQGSIGKCHLGLMGDPSLRQRMVAPPSGLVVSNAGGYASFSWAASTETVNGYHVYSIDATSGTITRITTNPVTGLSHTSATVPYVAGREYMVRAVKLLVEPCGSYYNTSLGVTAVSPGATADCNGVVGGPAMPGTPCNDGNACTANDALNASCQCVGASTAPAATITTAGATTFCSGGAVTLNANTGTGLSYQWKRNGTNITSATSASYTATLGGSYTVVVSSGSCGTTSSALAVTVNSAPAATITANGPTTFCGGSVTLSANIGSGYTYQWRRDGTWITGATTSTYAASTSGLYSVIVTSNGCSTTSALLQVTTTAAPAATITAGGATSFCSGGSVVLSANTGTGLTYQWRRDGVSISGATAATYTAGTAGAHTVMVSSGSCSTTSAAVTVAVGSAPSATITAGGSTTTCSNSSVTLSANTGTGLTYQWRRNGTSISGATSSTYAANLAGAYTVVVTSSGCSTTSSSTSVTVNTAPTATITAGGSTSFCTGSSVLLSASTGTGYTYQWARNGTNLSGATSATYTASTSGSYTVKITSGGCSATSPATSVTSSSAPTASITNGSIASFCTGASVLLTAATATGNSYQWRLNGAAISGATASTYAASATGNYTVTVTKSGCSATSATTVVSSVSGPAITCAANTANSTVSVSITSGTGPYTYSWSTVPEQTTATASVSASGSYTVTVRGANGCPSICTVSIALSGACTEPRTVKQAIWGAPATSTNLSGYMASHWAAAFPGPNYLQVGCTGRRVRFTTAQALIDNLPSQGSVALLPSGTTVNPSATAVSNTLMGHLVALKISVRMDEIDAAFCPSGALLKNMIIASGTFAGWTVQQLINHADQAIGNCVAQYPLVTISVALANINNGYAVAGQGSGYLVCPPQMMMAEEGSSTDLAEEARVHVFPNPTNGITRILLPASVTDARVSIDLLSALGAHVDVLHQGTAAAGVPLQVEWDARRWPAGAYICRIILGDAQWHARVIIE